MDKRSPAARPRPTRAEEILLFGRNFLKHPRMLGSLIPSSRFLVNRLLSAVDWGRADAVVEYGPGVGTFTGEILRRMRSDAVLLALETNGDFVQFLRRRLPDPRLHVIHGSAAEADAALRALGRSQANYVISGIPFTTIPPESRERILRTTHAILDPEGAFLVYQFTRTVLPSLEQVFGPVRQDFEPRNVMPARLFFCHRRPERHDGERNGRTRGAKVRTRASGQQ